MRHPLGRSVVPSPLPPGSAAGGGGDWARGRSAPRVVPAATIKPNESTHFHRRDPKLMRDTMTGGSTDESVARAARNRIAVSSWESEPTRCDIKRLFVRQST